MASIDLNTLSDIQYATYNKIYNFTNGGSLSNCGVVYVNNSKNIRGWYLCSIIGGVLHIIYEEKLDGRAIKGLRTKGILKEITSNKKPNVIIYSI